MQKKKAKELERKNKEAKRELAKQNGENFETLSDDMISQSSGEKYQKELELFQSRFAKPKKNSFMNFSTQRSSSVTEQKQKLPTSLPYALTREELFINEIEPKKAKRMGGLNPGVAMRQKEIAEE